MVILRGCQWVAGGASRWYLLLVVLVVSSVVIHRPGAPCRRVFVRFFFHGGDTIVMVSSLSFFTVVSTHWRDASSGLRTSPSVAIGDGRCWWFFSVVLGGYRWWSSLMAIVDRRR